MDESIWNAQTEALCNLWGCDPNDDQTWQDARKAILADFNAGNRWWE